LSNNRDGRLAARRQPNLRESSGYRKRIAAFAMRLNEAFRHD